MCRLFAQASTRPATARELLVDAEFSLLRQADLDPAKPQHDGWGIAWFDAAGAARVTKSGKSAATEKERFTRAADQARSTTILGHIRAASKGVPVDDAHAHPFEDEGWAFAHNGFLTIHREVAAELGPRKTRLKAGASDTEIYFQQFLKHLAVSGDPSRAFEDCVAENWRLWKDCASKYPGLDTPYTSLNALASNGTGVHALCHASRKGMADCGICHRDQPWSVMSLSQRNGQVLLASEGLDGGEWTRLAPPETVSVSPEGERLAVRRRRLDLAARVGHSVPEVSRP